jgi:hypothetical protein
MKKSLTGKVLLLTLVVLVLTMRAQPALGQQLPAPRSNPTEELPPVVVTATGEVPARQQTDLSAGTNSYTLNQRQIDTIAQGENTPFSQILTRTPGVSADTSGAIHFRNEDPYYRTYINGTLLPSGINGFSQDIDTHFVQSVTTLVGALPAFYPEGNYGVVELTTKSGVDRDGGTASVYGGSYDTLIPSFSYGGKSGNTDFFFNGSYRHDSLGLENPTPAATAIHDETNQYKGFVYISHQIPEAGRVSFVFSGSDADFQIPNIPGQVSPFDFTGAAVPPTPVDSTSLNETQNEQTYYGFIAYQQTIDDFSFQISQVDRDSTVLFNPDDNGDLYYNGVAARVNNYLLTNGIQANLTWRLGDSHVVRAGLLADTQAAGASDTTYAYAVDPVSGNPVGSPEQFQDNHFIRGYDEAVYLQDEWKITRKWTLNYGGRFEQVKGYTDESQFSPRLNAVYQADKNTALHAGYARYFDPPPLLNVSATSVGQFDHTTNAADQDTDSPVKVEKSHYFDLGATHKFLPGLEVGVDGYYQLASDLVDDGQFGAANISSPYNYGTASAYGAEFSINYAHDGLEFYGNFSAADYWAKHIVSSEFEFDSDELAYINGNNIHPDQTQFYTASAGISYAWLGTTVHADATYGDGLRAGFANTMSLDPYYPVNFGIEHQFQIPGAGDVTVRLDVLNVFDQIYVLNAGTGIGEGAVKYGNRRGFFGGISYTF